MPVAVITISGNVAEEPEITQRILLNEQRLIRKICPTLNKVD
jgi:translation elongation factor EF-Tu-like GTPase